MQRSAAAARREHEHELRLAREAHVAAAAAAADAADAAAEPDGRGRGPVDAAEDGGRLGLAAPRLASLAAPAVERALTLRRERDARAHGRWTTASTRALPDGP